MRLTLPIPSTSRYFIWLTVLTATAARSGECAMPLEHLQDLAALDSVRPRAQLAELIDHRLQCVEARRRLGQRGEPGVVVMLVVTDLRYGEIGQAHDPHAPVFRVPLTHRTIDCAQR